MDTVKTNAATMNIMIALTSGRLQSGEDKLNAINRVLMLAAPAITENHGTLTRVSEEGIGAIFQSGCEEALLAALGVFRNAAASDGNSDCRITIGIHFGLVYLAKVGYGDFVATVGISDEMRVARRLSKSAHFYDAGILITGTAARRIRSFENRFSSRKIGAFCRIESSWEDIVYDVFDSDITDLKYRKRRSKLVFETGVDLFLKGDYPGARKYFIELLKLDRNDVTAKKYIFMCDRAISDPGKGLENKFLEIWQ